MDLVLLARLTILPRSKFIWRVHLVALGNVVKHPTDRTLQAKYLPGTLFCFCHEVDCITH